MVTIRARMMKPEARCQRYDDDDTRTQHTRHSLQTITPTVLTPSKTNSVAIILCPVPSASALSGCRRQLTDDASSSSNGGMMRRRRRRETRPFGASTRSKRGWETSTLLVALTTNGFSAERRIGFPQRVCVAGKANTGGGGEMGEEGERTIEGTRSVGGDVMLQRARSPLVVL